MARSKVKSRSHHDGAHLQPLTNVPTKYQLPTPYDFWDTVWANFFPTAHLDTMGENYPVIMHNAWLQRLPVTDTSSCTVTVSYIDDQWQLPNPGDTFGGMTSWVSP